MLQQTHCGCLPLSLLRTCFHRGALVAVNGLSPRAGILGLLRNTSSLNLVMDVDLDVGLAILAARVFLWGDRWRLKTFVITIFLQNSYWVLSWCLRGLPPPHIVSSVFPLLRTVGAWAPHSVLCQVC